MKLGAIIPADGSATEIGESGRLSIAAIEGQSKGGILSKACEYVQMLQEKQSNRLVNHRFIFEFLKKFHNDQIQNRYIILTSKISEPKVHRNQAIVELYSKRRSTRTKLHVCVEKMNY